MNSTPRSMRLQIAIFGRTNTGKSSLVNLLSGQDVSITSPVPGTTTDVVEKALEFAPLGPVLLLDTAGLDDNTVLGSERIKRTCKAFDRADIAILMLTPGCWGQIEDEIIAGAVERKIKVIAVINQIDKYNLTDDFVQQVKKHTSQVVTACCSGDADPMHIIAKLRSELLAALPENYLQQPPLLGNMIKSGDVVIMVVPLDIQAPRGRLILPQVQTIRDALDHGAMVVTVKEDAYKQALNMLPSVQLVVCDSQVVKQVLEATDPTIPCTTFSVLFSQLKGDQQLFLKGCNAIDNLQDGDRVLIAEACTHHPTCEDIGRVKLPRLLQQKSGKKLEFDFAPGRDFPENLSGYKLIVHCGSCMLNRQETLRRLARAEAAGIPIANYGMAIAYCQNVLSRIALNTGKATDINKDSDPNIG